LFSCQEIFKRSLKSPERSHSVNSLNDGPSKTFEVRFPVQIEFPYHLRLPLNLLTHPPEFGRFKSKRLHAFKYLQLKSLQEEREFQKLFLHIV